MSQSISDNSFLARQEGNTTAHCPYRHDKACEPYLEYLCGCSYSLCENVWRHYCEDRFEDCARYQVLKAGIPKAPLALLPPWGTARDLACRQDRELRDRA